MAEQTNRGNMLFLPLFSEFNHEDYTLSDPMFAMRKKAQVKEE